MRHISVSDDAVSEHIAAVVARVKNDYDENAVLALVRQLGEDTIEAFLSAGVEKMRIWVKNSPDKLKFTQFKEIYQDYFSNGTGKFVDGNYNAYQFLKNVGVTVFPYCDDEYIDIIRIADRTKRTSEIDHFFSKSLYPALAMCIYNLVPSGQVCNGIKLADDIGANPYETDIDSWSRLYPDIPIGVALESMEPNDCIVRFHPKHGMVQNAEKLGLEDRYKRHVPEAYRLLKNLQFFTDEKISELERMGVGDREYILSFAFGPQDPEEKKHSLRQKMLKDLTGY